MKREPRQTAKPFGHARHLLAVMTLLQLVWLAGIWLTGAAAHWQKLPLLLAYSAVCGLAVWMVPDRIVPHVVAWLNLCGWRSWVSEKALFPSLFLGVLLVGTVYASVQSGWPDEKHVFAASRVVAEHGVVAFFSRYNEIPWLGAQHPPLMPLIYGFAMSLFGVHLFVMRFVTLLLGVATLSLVYAIGKMLYDRQTGRLAAVLFVSTPFFFRLGTTALTDMPVTCCFVLGLFFILRLLRDPTYWLAGATGVCIGVGLLCRYTMVFLYLVLVGFISVSGGWRRVLPYTAVTLLVSGGLLLVWFGYALSTGVLTTQWNTLTYYAGFVAKTTFGNHTGEAWLLGSLLLRVPSGVGIANLPLLLVGGWTLLQRRSRSDVLLGVWIGAVCLPLVLTLPGPRYFFPAFPAFAIAMACGLERVVGASSRVVLLVLAYTGGALYLFVDWYRAAGGLFPR